MIYQGTSLVSNTGAATGGQHSYSQYIGQSFVLPAGQTTLTRAELNLQLVSAGTDITFGLQADSTGKPSGTNLFTATVPLEFLSATARWVSVPLYLTGLTAGATYWIVAQPAGTSTNYVQWNTNATASGVLAVSGDGVTWTTVTGTYSLFNVFNAAGGNVRNLIEDVTGSPPAPSRYTELTYSNGLVSTVYEYVGNFRNVRTLNYAGGVLTTVT